MDNSDVDDFVRDTTDSFIFEDDCKDDKQLTAIANSGHARLFTRVSDKWHVTEVMLFRKDGARARVYEYT